MAEPATQAPGQLGRPKDPYRGYNFKLEIQGVTEGHFAECSGLDIRVHAIAYREGGDPQVVRRLPGPVEYGDITLRYGLTDSRELWDWFATSVAGRVDRRAVSVVMLDSDGVQPVVRWNLFDAWLSEWRGASLNALDKGTAIESMTLVYERLERA